MKFAFFITDISKSGGTERMTISLSNELVKLGHEVTIISLMSDKIPFYDFDKRICFEHIYSFKKSLFAFYVLITFKLYHLLKKHQSDFIVDVITTMSLFSIPATFFLKTKVITWEHFNYYVNLNKPRMNFTMNLGRKLAAKYSLAIITLTQSDADAYLKELNCKTKVLAIPNFISKIPESSANINAKIAIAIGRLTYQKGFDILLDIWKKAQVEYSLKDWKLLIIGDGEDKRNLESQIERLNLNNSVELIPATPNIEEYYLNASLFLMTSRWEGLPMVLIECQAYGLPVISFNCKTGPAEIIKNGYNGILIDEGNNDEFSSQLNKLIADESLRNKLSNNAKINSIQFQANAIVSQWIKLFNDLKIR